MAKQFFTNGTGSQQTLTGSQDEKVAVYQTLADAEADLVNLEAGQIVATPDTGDENAQPVDVIQAGNMHAVTSNAVANAKYTNIFNKLLSVSGWYKIATFQQRNLGASISIDLFTGYYYHNNSSHKIQINFGWQKAEVFDFAQDEQTVFDKIRICYNSNNVDDVAIYVHYSKDSQNPAYLNINAGAFLLTAVNFETDSLTWQNTIEYNLGASGLYINGQSYNSYSTTEQKTGGVWIDGKPIYRKSFSLTVSSFPYTTGLSNVNEIIKIEAIAKDSSNNYFIIPYANTSGARSFYYNKRDGTIIMEGNTVFASVTITLEYTKTTN